MSQFKHIAILLLSLLLLACPVLSGSDDKPEKKKVVNDLSREHLVGKVKSVVEEWKESEIGGRSEKVLAEKQTYNLKGHFEERVFYFYSTETERKTYEYKEGRLFSETTTAKKENAWEKSFYKYDEEGKIKKRIYQNKEGKVTSIESYSYNKKDELHKMRRVYTTGKDKDKIGTTTIKYNKDGFAVSETGIDLEGNKYKAEVNYSDKGVLSSILHYKKKGSDESYVRANFNSKGWVTSIEFLDSKSKVLGSQVSEYKKVDKTGNWIEKATYALEKDGDEVIKIPMSIQYRTIKYFDEKK